MLNAVLSGKKRGTGLEGLHLTLGEANGAEDVLTATVFERLSYLPDPLVSKIFTQLGLEDIDAIDEIEFWPRSYLDKTSVELDVLIHTDTHKILIEAKRWDRALQQNPEQLARELAAWWSEDEEDESEKECILLTIGGMEQYTETERASLEKKIKAQLNKNHATKNRAFSLICCSWKRLYLSIDKAISEQEAGRSNKHLIRLRDDIAHAFSWHRIRLHPQLWLANLIPLNLKTSSFPDVWQYMKVSQKIYERTSFLGTLLPVGLSASGNTFDLWRLNRDI